MLLNERVNITKSKEKYRRKKIGVVAQLGEHLPCTQGVGSSILPGSTKSFLPMDYQDNSVLGSF